MTDLHEPSLYLLTRDKEIEKSDTTNPTLTADRTLSPNTNYIDLYATMDKAGVLEKLKSVFSLLVQMGI